MSSLIDLGQSDIVNLQNYLADKNFAGGYLYLKSIVDSRILNEYDPIKIEEANELERHHNNGLLQRISGR